jgi:tetratricopeptide (TPR) repeat protein
MPQSGRRLVTGPLVLLLALCACASRRGYEYSPEALRREAQRRVAELDPGELVVPYEVGEPALAKARELLPHASGDDVFVQALVALLADPQGFGLRYEWAATAGAKETLARGRGNCFSLSSTLIGLARGLGLRAYYLEVVMADPRWRTEGGVAVQSDHVAAAIDTRSGRLYVDYSGELARARSVRVIDDLEALAFYYNNRGYELLRDADLRGEAAPWEHALQDFEVATRIDPEQARAWNNLGVARARLGDDAAARQAYERALSLGRELQSAHLNLAALHLRGGDLSSAFEHAEAARRLDPRNPQVEKLFESLRPAQSAEQRSGG